MPTPVQVRRYLALGLIVGVPTAGPLVAGGMLLANGVQSQENARGAPANAETLARRFAPILRFDSREPLLPIDRDGYLAHAQLLLDAERRFHVGDVTTVVNAAPTMDTLPGRPPSCPPQGRFKACIYLLSLRGLRPRDGVKPFVALQQSILTAGPPAVYWHYAPAEHALQYWFFYDFNHFQNYHEGDWEQITIVLESDGEAGLLAYSSHGGGQKLAWSAAGEGTGRLGDHPIVYVARGSHANYFFPGSYRVPECERICSDHADGAGLLLPPDDYRLLPLDGTNAFAGDYGTGNFVLHGLQRVGYGVNVADPQLHLAQWNRPAEWAAAAAAARKP